MVGSTTGNRWLDQTTLLMLRAVALALCARLRELLWLREIFLIAQPPLLVQGGEFAFLNIFATLRNSIGLDTESPAHRTELFSTALVIDRPYRKACGND